MKTIKSIVTEAAKVVYVYTEDAATAVQFLNDAEAEGFIWSDGSKPTEKHISDFYAVHQDMTVNYVGTIGRIAFQAGSDNIIRVNYRGFISKKQN